MRPLVSKALAIAASQIGVREQLLGSNRGAAGEAYLRSAGLPGGNPWCASFVYWCIRQAAKALGETTPYVQSGGCVVVEEWAKAHGILSTVPEPGDVFLEYGVPLGETHRRADHTAFVTSVVGKTFRTVEGNTNDNGGREGIGVFARTRMAGPNYRFVKWAALAQAQEEDEMKPVKMKVGGKTFDGVLDEKAGITYVPVRGAYPDASFAWLGSTLVATPTE
jgi:hypothetical protein